jgi:hypothetical protein
MARDGRTQAIFTTADDQMQGLWALHRYLKAAADIAEPDKLVSLMPQGKFLLTHEWVRFYDPNEMVKQVCQMHEFLLCGQSLITLVSVCEAALFRLNEHLSQVRHHAPLTKNSKLLEWGFNLVKQSPVASEKAAKRLPETCGDLDNARRLRNCIVHRNGCYDEDMYFQQVIRDGWVLPQYEKRPAPKASEPIFLVTGRFEHLTRSHVEFLHILHNTVQKKEFRHDVSYNYEEEGKPIEWHRILSGRRDVKM